MSPPSVAIPLDILRRHAVKAREALDAGLYGSAKIIAGWRGWASGQMPRRNQIMVTPGDSRRRAAETFGDVVHADASAAKLEQDSVVLRKPWTPPHGASTLGTRLP